YAGESQQNSRNDTTIGGWNHDTGDGLPLAGTESYRIFAERARNGMQEFLRTAKSDGNHHKAESERTGESGIVLERENHQSVGEDSDNDGGDAIEHIRRIAHDEGGSIAAEPGEIDPAEKTDWNAE